MKRHLALSVALAGVLAAGLVGLPLRAADEAIDYDSINKIKAQGLTAASSEVMEISSWLTDVYGPRLTGSPNIKQAGDWAVATMKDMGADERRARAVAGRSEQREQRLHARLVERQVLSRRDLAADVSNCRHADGVDAGHQRPRPRRSRAGDRDDRSGAARRSFPPASCAASG